MQDERIFSLLYNIFPNEETKSNLLKQYEISYEFINHLEKKQALKLPILRDSIVNKKASSNEVISFYTSSIHNFINKIIYSHKNKTSISNFNSLLDSYELIFKLSEQHFYQLSLILNNAKEKQLIKKVNSIQENINTLKTYIIPNLPTALNKIFNQTLKSDDFQSLQQKLENLKNNPKSMNYKDIVNLHNSLKDQFYILSNYTASNIETSSQRFLDEEMHSLITVILFSFLTILFLQIFALKLKNLIEQNIDDSIKQIEQKNSEIEDLHKYIDNYIILSRTDLKGHILHASSAFCKISKYKIEELIGKPHNIIRHKDMPKIAFEDMWNTIKKGDIWEGEVKNRAKDGSSYWTKSTIGPTYDNDGQIIGYTSLRQDITQEKYAQRLNIQVTNLLDNANNGFLSFKGDLKIKEGYSKISLKILSQDELKDKNIANILFPNDMKKKEIFELGITNILKADNELSKEILISLLPEENIVNNKTFSIKYKILEENEFMVILEDISEKIRLQSKIDHENRMQRMIVAIATRKREFLDLKNNFFDFLGDIRSESILKNDIDENYLNITKSLHTFKGLLAQEELVNITQALHNLESEIIKLKNENKLSNAILHEKLLNNKLKDAFNKDIDLIAKILGTDFLEPNKFIKLDSDKFKQFEHKVVNLFEMQSSKNIKEYESILKEFLNLNQKSLKALLSIYPTRVENIASRLNKKINQLKIVGDEKITVRSSYEKFIKSLVHVFRNIVDHGVESPSQRVDLNKYEQASILCQYKLIDDNKTIQLVISDDGKGIDPNIIKQKALEKKIITEKTINNLSKDEIINLIFEDNFSTKDDSDMISGRGIGLSVVANELKNINGTYKVESEINIGTRFIFTFPAQVNSFTNRSLDHETMIKIINEFSIQYLKNNLQIECKDTIHSNSFEFRDFYSCVKLSNDRHEIFVIISYDIALLDSIFTIYSDEDIPKEQKLGLYQSITDENLNTIVGSSLVTLSDKFGEIELSPPLALDSRVIENLSNKNEVLNLTTKTNLGNFDNKIIIIDK